MSAKLLLNSWKEIADYVGRSERTVQRWEKRYGLPVRRPAGREHTAVIALASEIEAWTAHVPRAGLEILSRADKSPAEAHAGPVPELIPTVLCIDTHSQVLARRTLASGFAGYRVLAAPDIDSGLRLFNSHRVDIVVLRSPVSPRDSERLARQVQGSRPEVPILILSREAKGIPQAVLNLLSDTVQRNEIDLLAS